MAKRPPPGPTETIRGAPHPGSADAVAAVPGKDGAPGQDPRRAAATDDGPAAGVTAGDILEDAGASGAGGGAGASPGARRAGSGAETIAARPRAGSAGAVAVPAIADTPGLRRAAPAERTLADTPSSRRAESGADTIATPPGARRAGSGAETIAASPGAGSAGLAAKTSADPRGPARAGMVAGTIMAPGGARSPDVAGPGAARAPRDQADAARARAGTAETIAAAAPGGQAGAPSARAGTADTVLAASLDAWDTGAGGTTGMETISSEAQGLATVQPSRARAYADGVLTTVGGQAMVPDSEGARNAFQLPYRSSDVIGRLGDYDLLGELGRGAMGIVYRAYSLRLCRACAIKVMIPSADMSAYEILRFQNEAMLAARLQHPHIVSVFDAGEDSGQFYIVMELVDGRPLTTIIEDGSDEAMERGIRAIAEAARALHYAHGKGIVHRDVKPDNILVDGDGHPHVTDFGIAKNIATDARMTVKGMLMGTPLYMSPEQANGEVAAIGPRTDVYALGASLYELCTGAAPFESENVYSIISMILAEEPPLPREVARKRRKRALPLDLETICLKAIEKDAARRYQSAMALAEDLEAYLEDRPIAARPVSAAERLQKLIRRNRGMFVVAAVVFTTLLVVGGGFAAVMISTIQKTNTSLRMQDETAALEQAQTLERSIRVNMLQGRADVVRELVNKLREDPVISYLDVVRTDRTFAYTDLATRKKVEQRLQDPALVARIRAKFPELERSIEEVRTTAFENIDRNRMISEGLFDYDRGAWNDIVENVRTVVRAERQGGEPTLTVLKPIENSPACQACHGEEEEAGYGSNKVRAVLVVKRSQKAVEAKISENTRTTMMVGGGTVAAILVLVWLFARLFGVRLRRRNFGS